MENENDTDNLAFCTQSACGPQSKIVYTDPMAVPNQIMFGPCDDMCDSDNYLKSEKKITDWSENITKKYHGVRMNPRGTDEENWWQLPRTREKY